MVKVKSLVNKFYTKELKAPLRTKKGIWYGTPKRNSASSLNLHVDVPCSLLTQIGLKHHRIEKSGLWPDQQALQTSREIQIVKSQAQEIYQQDQSLLKNNSNNKIRHKPPIISKTIIYSESPRCILKHNYFGESGDERIKGKVVLELEKACYKDEF